MFSCSDDKKIQCVKYTELRLVIREEKCVNPSTTALAIRVVSAMSNGNLLERWQSIALNATPVRRRTIQSTATHPVNRQSTSEEEDAFFLSLETQIPLESMTFSRLRNPWGYQ